jgi:predicted CopG family antitoxin
MSRLALRRKARKTFSLSREAVKYLESLRAGKLGKSISSVLEELIRQRREAEQVQRAAASVSSYYDSLTDEQAAEERAWGAFAESQFPTDERS